MKTQEQIQKETDLLQDQILSDRDKYSRGHATEDAFRFCKDWQRIRAYDREAALFLAVEILKDAGFNRIAHLALLHYFDDDAEKILKNLK